MTELNYSFIIPVYNRPQEVKELLESFTKLTFTKKYEIVIVEDGSTILCRDICEAFSSQLEISYFFKENSGPGDSRNFGMQHAKGNYYIILDSDCILPNHYLITVEQFLTNTYVDCYGGADAAHDNFNNLQKAINYVMTSFYTTGGIRGNKKSVSNFEPRSFNMGISKKAFLETKGFSNIHPGEDPDLSIRLVKSGFKTSFLPNAFVYHKRRISWRLFYKQVKKFGLVRPILNSWHPETAKITYWFPTLFVIFILVSIYAGLFIHSLYLLPLTFYLSLLFVDSTIKNKSIYIGFLSLFAMCIQFFSYGVHFLISTFYIKILMKDPQKKFPFLFFK